MAQLVETAEEAIDAYVQWHEERGLMWDQPESGSVYYDDDRGGWVLENIRGEFAVITPTGELLEPVE